MTVSITIDSVEINGVDGRRLHGQISDTNVGGTIREVGISGLLTGTDVADLQDKWQTAKDVCNTRDKHCVISIDGSASGFLEEFFSGDGKTTGIVTYITGDTSRVGTATTMPFTLFITVTEVIVVPSSGGGSAGEVVETFDGQVGEWRLMKVFSDARTESRIMTIDFGLLYDPDAFGPFNFTAVASNGGKAEFEFGAGDLTGILFKVGQKLIVSASVNYDATHTITAISAATNKITTDTVFTSTDTGTASIGEADTPQEVYDAARAGLLTLLGVGADGTRDTTTGLVLTNETVEDKGDLLMTVLNAEWVEKSYDDNIRNYQLSLNTSEIPDWPDEAGPRPQVLNAIVSFSVDKVQAGTDDVRAMWTTIRAAVLADIAASSQATGVVGPIDEGISWDKKAGSVSIKLGFIAKNATVFEFSRVTSTHKELDYVNWKDSEGYDTIQTGPESVLKMLSVTVARTGVGIVQLTITPPVAESGYTYLSISEDDTVSNPVRRKEIGQVYSQTRSEIFKRFKFRSGASGLNKKLRERGPITGG